MLPVCSWHTCTRAWSLTTSECRGLSPLLRWGLGSCFLLVFYASVCSHSPSICAVCWGLQFWPPMIQSQEVVYSEGHILMPPANVRGGLIAQGCWTGASKRTTSRIFRARILKCQVWERKAWQILHLEGICDSQNQHKQVLWNLLTRKTRDRPCTT